MLCWYLNLQNFQKTDSFDVFPAVASVIEFSATKFAPKPSHWRKHAEVSEKLYKRTRRIWEIKQDFRIMSQRRFI